MPNTESKNGSCIQEIGDQKIPKRENDWLKVLFQIYVNSVSLYGFYVVFFEARLLTSLFSKYLTIRYYYYYMGQVPCLKKTKNKFLHARILLFRDVEERFGLSQQWNNEFSNFSKSVVLGVAPDYYATG